ncbi:MAG TPA: dihydrolipoyl dehydrogenase, partial [Solibacterales bacterium]|nr:dihydrolipoyl dehydrogenase [Bryobacterales bacterium]
PTKALLHTAEVWEYVKHSEQEGITLSNPSLDLLKVNARKNGIVNKHAKGVEGLMKKNKAEVIKGHARLLGKGKVEVSAADGSKKTIEAKAVIFATGSEARMLPGLAPDPKRIVTNIEILNLTEVPKKLGIIGSGAVGVEFASIYKRFGSDVTVFEML